MSNDLVINPHPVTFYYPDQPPFNKSSKNIRSSSFRGTNMVNCRNSAPRRSAGRVEPQLNGLVSDSKGVFELDSNRSNTAVNQAKILFQYQELPPLNPTTNKKIDQQKILIGFGGGQEGVQRAPVGVEFESNCSRIAVNKAKKRPPQTLCTFNVGRYRVSYSASDGIRSSQNLTIFYSKLIMKIIRGRGRVRVELLGNCRNSALF